MTDASQWLGALSLWLLEWQLLLRASPWLVLALSALAGACTGSFLNMMVHRLPLMAERSVALARGVEPQRLPGGDAPYNLAVPRSHCPHCRCLIPLWYNIPLLSYLWLRGHCAACGVAIPLRYLWLEMLAVALFVLAAQRTGGALIPLVMLWLASGAWLAALCLALERDYLPTAIAWLPLWCGLLLAAGGSAPGSALWAAAAVAALAALWLWWLHCRAPSLELLALAAAAGAWGLWLGLACLVALWAMAALWSRWRQQPATAPVPLLALAGIAAGLLV